MGIRASQTGLVPSVPTTAALGLPLPGRAEGEGVLVRSSTDGRYAHGRGWGWAVVEGEILGGIGSHNYGDSRLKSVGWASMLETEGGAVVAGESKGSLLVGFTLEVGQLFILSRPSTD